MLGNAGVRHSILLYSKERCPLCDEAREALTRLGREFPLVIEEVDITGDASLYERYKNIVPVVIINGGVTLGGRVTEDDVRSALLKGSARD